MKPTLLCAFIPLTFSTVAWADIAPPPGCEFSESGDDCFSNDLERGTCMNECQINDWDGCGYNDPPFTCHVESADRPPEPGEGGATNNGEPGPAPGTGSTSGGDGDGDVTGDGDGDGDTSGDGDGAAEERGDSSNSQSDDASGCSIGLLGTPAAPGGLALVFATLLGGLARRRAGRDL